MYSVSFSINVSICTIDLNIFIAIIFVLVYTTKIFFIKTYLFTTDSHYGQHISYTHGFNTVHFRTHGFTAQLGS